MSVLPYGLLRSQEFFRSLVDDYYFDYVRRFPNTLPDSSAFFDQSLPYAAQDKVDFLSAGGNPETIQIALLSSAEYLRLARTHALWSKWSHTPPPDET